MAKKRKSKGSKPLGTRPPRSDVPAPSDVSTREPSAGLSTDLAAVLGSTPLLTAAVLLVLSVAVGLSFGGVLENEFLNWDDDKYITDNLYVLSFSAENVHWMLTDTSIFYWHPLTYIVHAAEIQAWGMEPRMHHATSLVLHGLNALFVFLLMTTLLLAARRATDAEGPAPRAVVLAAGIATLLWAVHPLRVEIVAWAAQKKDLLSFLFMLVCFLAYLFQSTASEKGPRRAWGAVVLVSFALAMMAKPMAMIVAPVLLLLDFYPLRRMKKPWDVIPLVLRKTPIIAMTLASVIYSLTSSREIGFYAAENVAPLPARLVSALWGAVFPLVATLAPLDLVPIYPVELVEKSTLMNPRYAISLIALVALTAFTIRQGLLGRRAVLTAWAFYLVTVLPVSGIRQAGSIQTADRFAAIPTLGLFALLAAGLLWLKTKPERDTAGSTTGGTIVAALVLGGVLGFLSSKQTEVWRDSLTFWTKVRNEYPERAVNAHNNLGAIMHRQAIDTRDPADFDAAEQHYRDALAIHANHEGAWSNLGLIHLQRGQEKEAEEHLLRAVEIKPFFSRAHGNLALLYLSQGKRETAAEHYRKAIEGRGLVAKSILDLLEEELGSMAKDETETKPR